MDKKLFTKNSKLADDGVWIEGLPGMYDMKLKVRASNSKIVKDAVTAAVMEAAASGMDRESSELAQGKVLAEVVLLDWDNITDGVEVDGEKTFPKKVAYDPELARQWIMHPDTSEFRDLVESAALAAARKARESSEVLEGN